jgi:tetratricopeptide (TPR) repeat protein
LTLYLRRVTTGRHRAARTAAAGACLAIVPWLSGCFGSDGGGTTARTAPDLLEQGAKAVDEGKLDRAERLYEDVIKLDPDGPYGYYNLGLVDQKQDHLRRAERNYRRALALHPNFTPALFNLAVLRSQADGVDEAVILYQRVVTLQPKNAAAHYNLGVLLYQLGRHEEAAEQLSLAIELNPNLVELPPTSTTTGPDGEPIPPEAPPVTSPPVVAPDETASVGDAGRLDGELAVGGG